MGWHACLLDSGRAREHAVTSDEEDPFTAGQRCGGAEAESAAPSSGTVTATVPTTFPFASTRTVRAQRRPGRQRDTLGSRHGDRAGNGRGQALQGLLVPLHERPLKPGLRRQRRCTLLRRDGLAQGCAQRRLERDAEVGGHAAFLLLTGRVGQHQADARQRCDEQCDEQDRRTATDAHLVGVARHTRQGRRGGSHCPADSIGAVGVDSAVAVPAAFAAVTSTRIRKSRSSLVSM